MRNVYLISESAHVPTNLHLESLLSCGAPEYTFIYNGFLAPLVNSKFCWALAAEDEEGTKHSVQNASELGDN